MAKASGGRTQNKMPAVQVRDSKTSKGLAIGDGVFSLISQLQNSRNALNTNALFSFKMSYPEMREFYKNGVANKIVSLKADYALNDSIQFKNSEDEDFYEQVVKDAVREAFKMALAYGRAVITITEIGKMQDQPLSENFMEGNWKLDVFSGDLVSTYEVSVDLMDKNYFKPIYYNIRGYSFHNTRVIDFRYVLPPQYEAQVYYYGGISEFQLIRNQLIADGIVQRAAASILEKNSTVFYKVKDFKDLLARNQEGDLIKFFNILENNRSIYGAGMIDAEDDAFVLNQSLTDIDKVDTASIRRLAMVTSIPVAWLVGEDVQGLNASGKVESEQFFWMIKNLRETYCKSPINRLMTIFGKNPIKFKKSNDMTPEALIEYESKAIDNAVKLNSIGEDAQSYLVTKGVLKKDESLALFNGDDDAG